MKKKKTAETKMEYTISGGGMELNDALTVHQSEDLLRTQVYLTREEHQFLKAEASRLGSTKAAVLRGIIDDRMRVPEKGWVKNPLLAEPVEDSSFEGRQDGAVNHDEYIYGIPAELEPKR